MKATKALKPTTSTMLAKSSKPGKARKYVRAWKLFKAPYFFLPRMVFLCVCMVVAQLAQAQPVTVPDFSFENIDTGPGGTAGGSAGVLLGTAPNWDSSGNAGNGIQSVTNGDGFFDSATLPAPGDGTNYFYMNIGVNASGYCWQDIGPLQSNTTYTLTIAVGETLQGLTGSGFIALVNGESPFQTILASTAVDTTNYTAGTFSNVTAVYTTGSHVSGDLTILMEGTSGQQIVFDNIRLDAATPANPTALLPVLSSTSTSNSVFTGTTLAQPTNTVYIGDTVSLNENPAGTPPFTYQWLSDNGTGGVLFTPISGQTSSNLSINTSGFTSGSTIEYEVQVTSGASNSTSPAVSLTATNGPPVIFVDTFPTTAGDDVGDTVTFEAAFIGSGPISLQWLFDSGGGPVPIPGATNETLTLSDVQMTNAGSYSLVASNQFEIVTNDPGVLIVNTASTNSSDGVITSTAYQDGLGGNTIFTPTWVLATNSLIAGASPSDGTPSIAAFEYGASGGVAILTDGKPGSMPPAGNTSPSLAAAGTAPTGASVTYALPTNGAPYGWTITNITVYGGWADAGRIEQEYDIFYSPYASPSNFSSQINAGGSSGGYAGVDFQYPNTTGIDPAGLQCATRVTLTSTNGNGALVENAAGLQFFFNILAKGPENGWEGYGEIQIFGTPSPATVLVISNTAPQFAGDVVGSDITFTTAFSSTSPLNYQWMVDTGGGPSPIPGANSPILTLTNLQDSDSGSYNCVASNSLGTASSAPAALSVTDLPGPDAYGAIDAFAFQEDGVPFFYPTWTLPPGDLLEGLAPSAVGAGQFNAESASGVSALTDGFIGGIGSGNDVDMATCGPNAGKAVFYLFPITNAQYGYTITNIQVFGGWSDHGRVENECLVYYSTAEAPDEFTNALALWDYLPPNDGAIAMMSRVSVMGSGGPLASNVAGIEIDFVGGENGYEGYSEIAVYGQPTTNAVTIPPSVIRDIIPFVGNDVVGSSATFSVVFDSSDPMTFQWYEIATNGVTSPVSGGTAESLTLNNLQLSDTSSYFVVASNGLGTATSTTNTFTVNPAPTPVNGITEAFAYQQTFAGGPELAPTWTLAPGDLLEGLAASSTGPGNFTMNGDGPLSELTDGLIGYVGGTVFSFCSCGSGAGTTATYTLPGSANGYNISQIVTYGGWQDKGRDWQNYTVYYATAASPSTFTPLTSVVDEASLLDPAGRPNMTRVTIASSGGGPLATNVVAVEFNFATPAGQENGWQGYSELALYGSAAVAPLAFTSVSLSGGNLILSGSGGSAGSNYTLLSATNLLGPWVTNATGSFNGSGDFSNSIPVNTSVNGEFFKLETP
jgi:hypothetical protein